MFCSKICYGMSVRGANSPVWKGGVTPVLIAIRKSLQYRTWRNVVFKRDNFTCKKCGQKGGDLEAHHKKSFSKIIQEIKEKMPLLDLYDAAMVFAEMWDTNNGVTLCIKCHDKKGTHAYKQIL